jgi:hypothetical protein
MIGSPTSVGLERKEMHDDPRYMREKGLGALDAKASARRVS